MDEPSPFVVSGVVNGIWMVIDTVLCLVEGVGRVGSGVGRVGRVGRVRRIGRVGRMGRVGEVLSVDLLPAKSKKPPLDTGVVNLVTHRSY